MELRIQAAKTRSVSARELSRRMADLLDEIATEGGGLVVLRYGRPAALLVPLEPTVRRAARRVAIEQLDQTEASEPFQMPELDEAGRRLILEMADRAPSSYSADEWTGPVWDFSVVFGRLELAGLVENDDGSRWLTSHGEWVAAELRKAG